MAAPKLIIWDYNLQLAFMRKAPIDWPYTKDSGCMLWRGNFDDEGYLRLGYKYQSILATRVSLMLFLKLKEFKLCALHTCDYPSCINPWHLFAGTHDDNNKDRASKGRNKQQKGENNEQAKLTIFEVEYARQQVMNGRTQSSLAIELGISGSTISNIINGKTWRI